MNLRKEKMKTRIKKPLKMINLRKRKTLKIKLNLKKIILKTKKLNLKKKTKLMWRNS